MSDKPVDNRRELLHKVAELEKDELYVPGRSEELAQEERDCFAKEDPSEALASWRDHLEALVATADLPAPHEMAILTGHIIPLDEEGNVDQAKIDEVTAKVKKRYPEKGLALIELLIMVAIVGIVSILVWGAVNHNKNEKRFRSLNSSGACVEVHREYDPGGTYSCGSVQVGDVTVPQTCMENPHDKVTYSCQADGGPWEYTRKEAPRG